MISPSVERAGSAVGKQLAGLRLDSLGCEQAADHVSLTLGRNDRHRNA